MKITEKIDLGNGRSVSLGVPFVNEGVISGLQPVHCLAFRDEVPAEIIKTINRRLEESGSSHRLKRESFMDFQEAIEKTRKKLRQFPNKNPRDVAWRYVGNYDMADRVVLALE